MVDKTVNSILFNYFLDLRKKDINKRERAVLLSRYLRENNMSQRQLAKDLGIPHSTVQDWLMINRIGEDEYNKFIEEGMSDTDIYRMLRNNKKAKEPFDVLMLRQELSKHKSKYVTLINRGKELDDKTIDEIKDIINVLQRVLIHYERKI